MSDGPDRAVTGALVVGPDRDGRTVAIVDGLVVAEAPVKLSADGQTMYFSGGRLTDPINIYGCNLDGSNPQLAITPGMSSAGVYIGAIY